MAQLQISYKSTLERALFHHIHHTSFISSFSRCISDMALLPLFRVSMVHNVFFFISQDILCYSIINLFKHSGCILPPLIYVKHIFHCKKTPPPKSRKKYLVLYRFTLSPKLNLKGNFSGILCGLLLSCIGSHMSTT